MSEGSEPSYGGRRAHDRDAYRISQEALAKAERAENALTTHEALCALRYKGIAEAQERVEKRMDAMIRIGVGILLSVCGTVILLLVTQVLDRTAAG